MIPNTIILGPSGCGKSTSIKGLPPEETAILNTEQKALPFRGAGKYKNNIPISNLKEFKSWFKKVIQSETIKYIVLESFTSYQEQAMHHCERSFDGFDVYKAYNDELRDLTQKSKKLHDKYIFFIAIDQVIESPDGVQERYVAVQGNRWKKQVAKEFVNVLYATAKENDKGGMEYKFLTNKTKGYINTPTKSPQGMFPLYIDNDLGTVVKGIDAFINGDEEEEIPSNEETAKESSEQTSEEKSI